MSDWDDDEPDRQPFIAAACRWARRHDVTGLRLMGHGWTGEGICEEPARFDCLAVHINDEAVPVPPDAPHLYWHLTVYVTRKTVRGKRNRYLCHGEWFWGHPKAQQSA